MTYICVVCKEKEGDVNFYGTFSCFDCYMKFLKRTLGTTEDKDK